MTESSTVEPEEVEKTSTVTTVTVGTSDGTTVTITTDRADSDFVFRLVHQSLEGGTGTHCDPSCDVASEPDIPNGIFSHKENAKGFRACKHCGRVFKVTYLKKHGPPSKPAPYTVAIDSAKWRKAQRLIQEWKTDNPDKITDMVMPAFEFKEKLFTGNDKISIRILSDGFMVPVLTDATELVDDIPKVAIYCWLLEHQWRQMHRSINNVWKEGAS